MKVRNKKAKVKLGSNPLRTDPTRTITLRRNLVDGLNRKFNNLKREITKLIAEEDALGLVVNRRWQFQSSPEKVRAFQAWLRSKMPGIRDEELWRKYIEAGFKKGAGRAFDDVKVRARTISAQSQQRLDFYRGTREEFLKSSFAQPETEEKVLLLAGRAFDDLEGITDDMGLRMSRVLTDGLVQGKNPREIAKDLTTEVDLGKNRADLIARTEIIRAHAEGQLNALESLGVEEVGVMVEWSTAGDDRVCPLCEALEGIVLTIQEAKGLIPRHPRCRCSFIPAQVGEDDEEQLKSKADIMKAVRKSIRLEDEEEGEDNWGLSRDIDVDRPDSILNQDGLDEFSRLLFNVFCPTGEGGGVDPTCSPGQSRKVVTGVDEMANLQADLFEAKYGWTEGKTREGFLKNWKKKLRGTEAPQEIVDKVQTAVDTAVKDYNVPRVDVVVRKGIEDDPTDESAHWNRGGESGYITFRAEPFQEESIGRKDIKTQSLIVATQAYPDETVGVYIHEVGHKFEDENPGSTQRARAALEGITADEKKRLRGFVSGYGVTRADEMVAESYTIRKHPDFNKLPEDRKKFINHILYGTERESVDNIFCPTGRGGGVDPTCSPGEGSSELDEQQVKRQAEDDQIAEARTLEDDKLSEARGLIDDGFDKEEGDIADIQSALDSEQEAFEEDYQSRYIDDGDNTLLDKEYDRAMKVFSKRQKNIDKMEKDLNKRIDKEEKRRLQEDDEIETKRADEDYEREQAREAEDAFLEDQL